MQAAGPLVPAVQAARCVALCECIGWKDVVSVSPSLDAVQLNVEGAHGKVHGVTLKFRTCPDTGQTLASAHATWPVLPCLTEVDACHGSRGRLPAVPPSPSTAPGALSGVTSSQASAPASEAWDTPEASPSTAQSVDAAAAWALDVCAALDMALALCHALVWRHAQALHAAFPCLPLPGTGALSECPGSPEVRIALDKHVTALIDWHAALVQASQREAGGVVATDGAVTFAFRPGSTAHVHGDQYTPASQDSQSSSLPRPRITLWGPTDLTASLQRRIAKALGGRHEWQGASAADMASALRPILFGEVSGQGLEPADVRLVRHECGICWSDAAPGDHGGAAATCEWEFCASEACRRPYHLPCLQAALAFDSTCKQVFQRLHGACPFCGAAMSVPAP